MTYQMLLPNIMAKNKCLVVLNVPVCIWNLDTNRYTYIYTYRHHTRYVCTMCPYQGIRGRWRSDCSTKSSAGRLKPTLSLFSHKMNLLPILDRQKLTIPIIRRLLMPFNAMQNTAARLWKAVKMANIAPAVLVAPTACPMPILLLSDRLKLTVKAGWPPLLNKEVVWSYKAIRRSATSP